MEFGITILILVLWFGLTARKAYRKALSGLESEPEGSTAAPKGTVKSAFETLFDEVRKPQSGMRGSSTFASEAASAGYYSYETTGDVAKGRAAANAARPAPTAQTMRPAEVRVEADATAFDLRQAVIYQTILTNKYLSDMQTYDN